MSFDFDAVVVGAGVVGLAIATALAKTGKKVIVLEANENIGQETSSRNSGVIHAGIYYDKNSLKAKTCVSGRHLLYEYLEKHKVNYKKIGKYIVTNRTRSEQLEKLFFKGIDNGVGDLKINEKKYLEKKIPEIRADIAIYSPSTGILDVHGFMNSLTGEIQDYGGYIAKLSKFIFARRTKDSSHGWEIQVSCGKNGTEKIMISSHWVINAAGLFAESIAKQIEGYPTKFIPETYFVKGNYFTVGGNYSFDNLIYPLPEKDGLGIHLTLDLSNQVILGPDTEPLEKENIYNSDGVPKFDYSVDKKQREKFFSSVVKWWPHLKLDSIQPGYSGIRPKLKTKLGTSRDFIIQGYLQTETPGLINLYGIESPGLTASLSLADLVAKQVADYD